MIAASTVVQIIYVAAFAVLWLGSATITILKGRVALFVVGLFTLGLVWVLGALAPAREGSAWARWRAGRGARP